MRRHILAITLAGTLALGACGSSGSSASTSAAKDSSSSGAESTSGGSTDPAVKSAKDSAALMKAAQPVFVDLFQSLADQAQTLSADQLVAMAQGKTEDSSLIKDFTAKLERDGAAIEAKAKDLNCSEDDAKKAMCEAVKNVDGKSNVMAEAIISGMTSECA